MAEVQLQLSEVREAKSLAENERNRLDERLCKKVLECERMSDQVGQMDAKLKLVMDNIDAYNKRVSSLCSLQSNIL